MSSNRICNCVTASPCNKKIEVVTLLRSPNLLGVKLSTPTA